MASLRINDLKVQAIFTFPPIHISLFFFFKLFIYFFLAALGLRCYAWAFSSCPERGLLFADVCGLLLLRSTGSVVVVHGLSGSTACGNFLDQGSNPCPLHWQANSQPLRHQGSPNSHVFTLLI